MEQKDITQQQAPTPPTRKRWAYVSARDVLPADLLAAVQEHFSGGFIYIPPPVSSYYAERRKLVLALRLQGVPTAEIAAMAASPHAAPGRSWRRPKKNQKNEAAAGHFFCPAGM